MFIDNGQFAQNLETSNPRLIFTDFYNHKQNFPHYDMSIFKEKCQTCKFKQAMITLQEMADFNSLHGS